jgi:hypothetical protein
MGDSLTALVSGRPTDPEAVRGADLASHRLALRGLTVLPQSPFHEGRFGRMFRNLPFLELTTASIESLAEEMLEPAAQSDDDSLDNPDIPAGFTYLGQFLDHDITFDPVSSLTRQNDPDALRTFRTPRLDLDSVYGSGPDDQPYLYDQEDHGETFLIGDRGTANEDLQRNSQGRALIGDPRNDENMIISQVQHAWLRFHNQVMADLRAGKHHNHLWSHRKEDRFREAQRIVRWHYQWIIIEDFLRRIVGNDLVEALAPVTSVPGGIKVRRFDPKPRYYSPDPSAGAFIPIEFSAAAYRYGHSQIRSDYELNDVIQDKTIFPTADHPGDTDHLKGFRPLIPGWKIQWRRFFELGGADDDLQRTRLIDTKLAVPLAHLPEPIDDAGRSLALRNLLRGLRMDLPSGQSVARLMGFKPLTAAEAGPPGDLPLWYYVLAEAKNQQGGKRLGAVGGRLVAEVILGLIDADRSSFLRVEPGWQPFLGAHHGKFTMAEMLTYAVPEFIN